MAQIQYLLGFIDDAQEKFRDCVLFFEKESIDGYLNSLHGLASCYTIKGDYKKSSLYVAKGMEIGIQHSIHRMDLFFQLVEGINYYHQKKYSAALLSLENVSTQIAKKGDFANAQLGYYYLAKIYQEKSDEEKAKVYFEKVDSLFERHSYVRPDLRDGFDFLSEYYLLRQMPEQRFYFMSQRRKADAVMEEMYKDLYPRLFQREVKTAFEGEKSYAGYKDWSQEIKWLLVFGLLGLGFYYKEKIRSRFRNMVFLSPRLGVSPFKAEENFKIVKNVPQESLEVLLPGLEKFEREKKFLEKEWKQVDLAVYLKTNVQYVKLLIQQYRHKNYSQYMNDLKIEYVLNLLEREGKYRRYTNAALAKEGGFQHTDKFVKAFKKRTGKKILEYIEELES